MFVGTVVLLLIFNCITVMVIITVKSTLPRIFAIIGMDEPIENYRCQTVSSVNQSGLF